MTSTVSIPWPDHPIGLDEWDALDEDTHRRAELVEGVVVLAPSPPGSHQRLGWRRCAALEPALRPKYVVVPDVEVLVDRRALPTVRGPDVAVVRAEAGVAHYGILDPGPPTHLAEFGLRDERYELVAEHHGAATLTLGVTLDLDALR